MKGPKALLFLAALSTAALAEPIQAPKTGPVIGPADLLAHEAPSAVSMEKGMRMKIEQQAHSENAGEFAMNRYYLQKPTPCKGGKAGEYSCSKLDLKGFLRHQDMDSATRRGNDIWGWTAPDGSENALVGQSDGTAFVRVMPDGSLRYLGRLDTQTGSSIWRDIKVIDDHAYIGSEAANHGLQVFNLRELMRLDANHPVRFDPKQGLTAHFGAFGSSHNIVANAETRTIFAVGTGRKERCRGGLWMVDVSNPRAPQDNGCVSEDGYVHDAQCIIYRGLQQEFHGHEICYCYNEDSLTIFDISDRRSPKQLSRTTYKGASYTHQGWLATSDQRYLLLDDEQDELQKAGMASDGHTTTYIVDAADLTKPVFTGIYKSPVKSIDHNQYVVDGISYQANYGSGLRMVNVSTIAEDNTGSLFKELAFFDVYPLDDAQGGEVSFHGAWSVYPFFKSGHVIVNSIERGVFSLKYAG